MGDEYLVIHEACSLAESPIQADGTVLMQVIRPCVGKGKGTHYYSREMLREHAHIFTGWPMFVDHESPEMRRRRAGLPRSVNELGGKVLESWWDDSVPAEGRFEQGAVMGKVVPTPFIKTLIETHPTLVEGSINALATGTHKIVKGGQQANAVEGMSPKGTFDWVTEAGAGGKVLALAEAYLEEHPEEAVVEIDLTGVTDAELIEYLSENRPDTLDALREAIDPDGDGDDDTDEVIKRTKSLLKKHKGNMKAARAEAIAQVKSGGDIEEGFMDTEELQETVTTAISTAISAPEFMGALEETVARIVDTRMQENADVIRAEALGESRRDSELYRLGQEAHQLIEAQKLPEIIKERMRAKYAMVDGEPTPELAAIEAEVDDDFHITKPASEVLREAIDEDVKDQRQLLESLHPTTVRGAGAVRKQGEAGGGEAKSARERLAEQPPALQEAAARMGFGDASVFGPTAVIEG